MGGPDLPVRPEAQRQRPPGHAAFEPKFQRQVEALHRLGSRALAEAFRDASPSTALISVQD